VLKNAGISLVFRISIVLDSEGQIRESLGNGRFRWEGVEYSGHISDDLITSSRNLGSPKLRFAPLNPAIR